LKIRARLNILKENLKFARYRLIMDKWSYSLKKYQEWSRTPLPESYVMTIIDLGKKFSEFVGEDCGHYVLDVGCGNGLFSGKSYNEIGYRYFNLLNAMVIGLDPLPLEKPIPWINRYVNGIGENIPFSDSFFSCVISATSIDHMKNPFMFLKETKRVLKPKGRFFVWTTVTKKEFRDMEHIKSFSQNELLEVVSRYFEIEGKHVEFFSEQGDTVFLKCEKNESSSMVKK